ncbi:MAG: hypothetical protein JRD94_01545 [Deltaproteobacteria bacterium]|nr:hypothetical protein [Deltaproteobacteria bacterium]
MANRGQLWGNRASVDLHAHDVLTKGVDRDDDHVAALVRLDTDRGLLYGGSRLWARLASDGPSLFAAEARNEVKSRQRRGSVVCGHFALSGGGQCGVDAGANPIEQTRDRRAQDDWPAPGLTKEQEHQRARKNACWKNQLRHRVVVRAVARDGRRGACDQPRPASGRDEADGGPHHGAREVAMRMNCPTGPGEQEVRVLPGEGRHEQHQRRRGPNDHGSRRARNLRCGPQYHCCGDRADERQPRYFAQKLDRDGRSRL